LGNGIRVEGRNQDSELVEEDKPGVDQFGKFENLKKKKGKKSVTTPER